MELIKVIDEHFNSHTREGVTTKIFYNFMPAGFQLTHP